MSFDPTWLDLREPADDAARATALEALLAGRLPAQREQRIVDLGCGTGSNLRRLAPQLGPRQHWTLVDSDPQLLAAVPEHLAGWAADRGLAFAPEDDRIHLSDPDRLWTVELRQADLAAEPVPAEAADLVTGSALLDLVSQAWLDRLAGRCAELAAAALFALTYDGVIGWSPSVAFDEGVLERFNRHMTGDKGFGPALGPAAHPAAAEAFRGQGFQVEEARSDWRLGPADVGLQQHLLAGWAAAASEAAPADGESVQAWLVRRIDLLEAGQSRVTVGHMDLLALPRR